MYINENGNGKRSGIPELLGDYTSEVMGSFLGNAWTAAAFRVLRKRVDEQRLARAAGAPAVGPTSVVDAARRVAGTLPVSRPAPSINVVSLPNGTAVPSTNGASPVVPPTSQPFSDYTPPVYRQESGSGFGPPPDMPGDVVVGTLEPEGEGQRFSTAGVSSLAGLTSNPMALGLIALGAYLMLDGKPKRKRRR